MKKMNIIKGLKDLKKAYEEYEDKKIKKECDKLDKKIAHEKKKTYLIKKRQQLAKLKNQDKSGFKNWTFVFSRYY